MKNKKYIICSGLAFSDCEDMELLHVYAKKGWIFKKLTFGVLYTLYREEPQDIIFDYDLQKIKKQDKDDYLAIFEEAGWKPVGTWNDEVHFFYADTNTPRVHSEVQTRSQQYKSMNYMGMVVTLLGIICTLLAMNFQWILWYVLGGGFLGGGIILWLGGFRRMRGKTCKINPRTYTGYILELIVGLIFTVLLIRKGSFNIYSLIVAFVALIFLIGSIHGIYNLRKERKLYD